MKLVQVLLEMLYYFFACWEILHAFLFCRLLIFFKINVFKKFFHLIIIRVSKNLDSDQVRQKFRPDLGLNWVPRNSAEDTSKYRVNVSKLMVILQISFRHQIYANAFIQINSLPTSVVC